MTSTRPAISGATITAIALGVVGILVVATFFPGLKVLGLLLGVAAIFVGGLGAANARRSGQPVTLPLVGAALGVVAAVWFLVWSLTV